MSEINNEIHEGNASNSEDPLIQKPSSQQTNLEEPSSQQTNLEEPSLFKKLTKNVSPYRYLLPYIFLFLYVVTAVATICAKNESFKGPKTHKIVDAVYFAIITLCTVGYGDIVPHTTFTKMITCVLVLVGVGYFGFILDELVGRLCGIAEEKLVRLKVKNDKYWNIFLWPLTFDLDNMKISSKTKIHVATCVFSFFIAFGTFLIHISEKLNWIDSIYLSISTVTTVGYGDFSFYTLSGRVWAIIWVLGSTFAIQRSFLYFHDYNSQNRSRDILDNGIALSDLDGVSISKYDYAMYILKKMGRISETEIQQISKKFDSMPHDDDGNIPVNRNV